MLSVSGTKRHSATRGSAPVTTTGVGSASASLSLSDAVNSALSSPPRRVEIGIRERVADELAAVGALQVGHVPVAGQRQRALGRPRPGR